MAARGLQFAAIHAGKFRRNYFAGPLAKVLNLSTLGPNIRDLGRLLLGVVDSWRILRGFKPDVVFLKGGFVCLPVGIAARLLRIPYVIHESDVSPGLANKLLARWAQRIAVGFPVKHYRQFDPARLVYVGNPVRPDLLSAHRLEGLAHFKLDDKLPVVLVTGGSQGAAQINDVVVEALPELLEFCQIIHQTGAGEFERVKFKLTREEKPQHFDHYHPVSFLTNDMGQAYAVADLVVGRAGVNAITDAAATGKPTVLIPNYEMAGHQVENARVLSRQGAARVLDGATLTPERLVGEIRRVLGDSAEQERLSRAIRQFGRPDAAGELAKVVLEVARRGGERAEAASSNAAEEVSDDPEEAA